MLVDRHNDLYIALCLISSFGGPFGKAWRPYHTSNTFKQPTFTSIYCAPALIYFICILILRYMGENLLKGYNKELE